jgi:transcriptional regulator with XRE-family HTH domain
MTITPEQCRAARALLDWSQTDLAKAAGTGQATVARFERGARTPYANTLKALRATLETAGVVFTPGTAATGPGVHLRDPQKNIVLSVNDDIPRTMPRRAKHIENVAKSTCQSSRRLTVSG